MCDTHTTARRLLIRIRFGLRRAGQLFGQAARTITARLLFARRATHTIQARIRCDQILLVQQLIGVDDFVVVIVDRPDGGHLSLGLIGGQLQAAQ